MLRIGKQNASEIVLPQISAVPSSDDLQFVLSKAQRNWRAAVRLPWKEEGGAQFVINVQCDMEFGEPYWTLFRKTEQGWAAVWQYCSLDAFLIQNLLRLAGSTEKELPPDLYLSDPARATNRSTTCLRLNTLVESSVLPSMAPPKLRKGLGTCIGLPLKNIRRPAASAASCCDTSKRTSVRAGDACCSSKRRRLRITT